MSNGPTAGASAANGIWNYGNYPLTYGNYPVSVMPAIRSQEDAGDPF